MNPQGLILSGGRLFAEHFQIAAIEGRIIGEAHEEAGVLSFHSLADQRMSAHDLLAADIGHQGNMHFRGEGFADSAGGIGKGLGDAFQGKMLAQILFDIVDGFSDKRIDLLAFLVAGFLAQKEEELGDFGDAEIMEFLFVVFYEFLIQRLKQGKKRIAGREEIGVVEQTGSQIGGEFLFRDFEDIPFVGFPAIDVGEMVLAGLNEDDIPRGKEPFIVLDMELDIAF